MDGDASARAGATGPRRRRRRRARPRRIVRSSRRAICSPRRRPSSGSRSRCASWAKRSGIRLEIWRRGGDLELVRFLAPRERGKFLLRRDRELYFIAPGSRRPVKLAPSYRVQGAAIRELLGLRLVRDYRISALREEAGIVTFELVANDGDAAAPRLRWVVSRATGRPLRADLQSSAGKVLRVIEFRKPGATRRRGVPKLLVIKDVVRGGAPIEIRFLSFEPGPVDPVLFGLEDGAARAASVRRRRRCALLRPDFDLARASGAPICPRTR